MSHLNNQCAMLSLLFGTHFKKPLTILSLSWDAELTFYIIFATFSLNLSIYLTVVLYVHVYFIWYDRITSARIVELWILKTCILSNTLLHIPNTLGLWYTGHKENVQFLFYLLGFNSDTQRLISFYLMLIWICRKK